MISIIIPVLNEEAFIGKLLEYLIANSSEKNISEIIVVDGGSTDTTQNIIKSFVKISSANNAKVFHYVKTPISNEKLSFENKSKTKIILLNSKKGRAKQMNLGAKSATGNILYFLHADSFPPKNFDTFIIDEVEKGNLAGCFKMQFDSNHWWLKLSGWLTKFSWRACRGGDQSQFITKTLFNQIDGFDERYMVYEDNILINELYSRNQFVVINKTLKTSARMYEKHGIWKLQYFYWSIYFKKWMGASPNMLTQYYIQSVNVKN